MRRRTGSAALVILGLLMAGCGSHQEASGTGTAVVAVESGTEAPENGSIEEKANRTGDNNEVSTETLETAMQKTAAESQETAPVLSGEIHMENPSWDYYSLEASEPAASPLRLVKLTEEANQITDTEEWFEKNNLTTDVEDTGNYTCEILTGEGGEPYLIRVTKKESGESYILNFSDYQFANDFKESDASFVRQTIRFAQVKDDILYLSIGHLTYAETSPHNAYVAAVDLNQGKLLWKSRPLVSNAHNFMIKGDVLLCGYGFTAEPDNLYQLDLATGQVIAELPLKSMADYLILKDDTLYVRTYNTDYTFRVE
ncbi:PQQ-like beta-propeller repeat protein [[Clostridium] symbiosum]|uniref:PQQ-like beta-propeller repeat protein n=1 Tax=Clostridium symbiosum TaxID=1512 RepID=UPI001D05F791|nr:PQQ-like beta-propeller repeat protein [[Clostridium] symbiosum]MCB6608113.1 PQQ-like beta-propeller repeat protein [[Clostridium] symbiosum]MCB6931047.1 PQQ-like beta-propeller repeat protein [[Clostridium] symbiosum]